MSTTGVRSWLAGLSVEPLAVVAVLLALVSLAMWLLAPLLVPLIIAVAMYVLLEPLVSRLTYRGLPHTGAVAIALLLVLLIMVVVITLIAPRIFEQLAMLQKQLPGVVDALRQQLANLNVWISERTSGAGANRFFELFSSYSSDWGRGMLLGISGGLIRVSVVLILVPLFTYFLLVDYRSLRNMLMSRVSNAQFELAWLIYYRVARQLQRYIRGVLLQALVMAIMTSVGFAMAGLDMWLLLGVVTGLLNLIPYVGPLMAMVIAIIVAIAQAGMDPTLLGAAALVILVAQLIDNTVVVPALIAEAANLHPLGVIVGVIIFGNLFGFIGMVLAVPALAAVRIIYTELQHGLSPPAHQFAL